MMGAFIFILSALKLPSVTGSISHPTCSGLAAVIFGPGVASVLSMIVLVSQPLLLAHGGITTLGANIVSMGVVGLAIAFIIWKIVKKLVFPEKNVLIVKKQISKKTVPMKHRGVLKAWRKSFNKNFCMLFWAEI